MCSAAVSSSPVFSYSVPGLSWLGAFLPIVFYMWIVIPRPSFQSMWRQFATAPNTLLASPDTKNTQDRQVMNV